MKQFFKRFWTVLNSPAADIIGGYIFIFVGFYLWVKFLGFDKANVFAWVAGFVSAVGFDCVGHGFDRRNSCKSSAPVDDNKESH